MRVLIGPIARQADREDIEQLLDWAPAGMVNTNVVHWVEDWPALLDLVRIGADRPALRYDMLVAEFRLPGHSDFSEIYLLDPTISVIDIDLERRTHHTPMFDVGNVMLRRLAEWLATKSGLRPKPGALTLLAADEENAAGRDIAVADVEPEEDAPVEPAPEEPPAPETTFPRLVVSTDPASADKQRGDLIRWLELLLALKVSPSSADMLSLDVPGWSIDAKRVRALLDEDNGGDTLARWRTVDADLHGHVEAAKYRPNDGSLGAICNAFDLDEIDRQILWLVAAPDLAGNLAQAIGFLNDDLSLRRPTSSLLAQLIEGAGAPWQVQQRLTERPAFAYFRLASAVQTDPLTPESLVPLKVPSDLVAMLCGRAADTADGIALYDPADYKDEAAEFDPQLALAQFAVGRTDTHRPIVHFHAPASEGPWLARQLASAGNRVLLGNLASVAALDSKAVLDRLLSFGRAALVERAILVVAGLDEQADTVRDDLAHMLVHDLAPHLKLVVAQGTRIAPTLFRRAAGGVAEISRPRPTREERSSIWTRAAADRGLVLADGDARELGSTFAFDRDQAEATIALAVGSGVIELPNASEAELREAARLVSRASAPPSVTRIETRHGWDDIILPPAIKADLQSIAAQVRYGTTVWEDWGFGARVPYGQAMIALLAGPSGTGKTMAAQIIAGELGAALFQVDLAKTVSKYIGETEKALDRIFEAAEAASAVLLFDEADALFGKRSEIHDAHDRYANIEVNFLLQRIEDHLAPVLLTTNRKANIDAAFLRRLTKVVDFPMPDDEQRGAIWRSMLPPEARIASDVDLQAFRQLPLSGGSIANAVVAAAFMGAEDGGMIRMRHLVAAARGELAKSGMQSAGRSLAHLIERDAAEATS